MKLEMPDEIAEAIVNAHWNGNNDKVTITDIHQHNACNHTLSGIVKYNGEDYGFIVDSGDWNGFEVREFGPKEDVGMYTPPEPTRYMFVPNDPFLKQNNPLMFGVYLLHRKQQWFIDKLNAYHYDKHFQPGCFVETHYRDWAAARGMRIEPVADDDIWRNRYEA